MLKIRRLFLITLSCALAPLSFAETDINPNFIYLYKGQPQQRSISLGDPSNWSLGLQGREGKSASGKLIVSITDFKDKGDALNLEWDAKVANLGSFSLYGNPVDLSKFKDAAALTIDMRVESKPSKDVRIGMDCGYPCRADLVINNLIRKMPKGEWFSLPIPLNCFKSDNFDLSKINGPFTIATDGKFRVSITNVRLERLQEGEKGCAENSNK